MATPNETFKGVESLIEDKTATFDRKTLAAQNSMWASVFKIIKNLEIDEQGNIKPSTANLKRLRTLRRQLMRNILTKGYRQGVNAFLDGFEGTQNILNRYFSGL